MRLVAHVEHPDQLRPVLGVVLGRLVGDQHQVAVEQRHRRVHEAGIGRRIGPVRDHLRIGFVLDVHHEHAAVDVAEIEPVRPLRIDVGVVRAIALVERVARRRRDVVGGAGAGHPPAADLDRLRRIAHVDAAVELVVVRMARLEVGRARRHVHVFAVAEPQLMHAARGRARAVEERDRARLLRHRARRTVRGRPAAVRPSASDRRPPGCRRTSPASSSAYGLAAGRSAPPPSDCADRTHRRR